MIVLRNFTQFFAILRNSSLLYLYMNKLYLLFFNVNYAIFNTIFFATNDPRSL